MPREEDLEEEVLSCPEWNYQAVYGIGPSCLVQCSSWTLINSFVDYNQAKVEQW